MKVTGAVMHAAAGYKYGGNATDLLSALLFSVDTLLLSFVTVQLVAVRKKCFSRILL